MFENNLISFRGQKILGHSVLGLLLGFNSKFVMSIPPFHMRCPPQDQYTLIFSWHCLCAMLTRSQNTQLKEFLFRELVKGNIILLGIPQIAGHSSFFCTLLPAWHRACWKILQRSQQNFEPLWYFYLMLFLLRACQLHWFLKMEHGWRDIPLVIANPPLEKWSLTLVSQGELIFGKSMTDSQGKS